MRRTVFLILILLVLASGVAEIMLFKMVTNKTTSLFETKPISVSYHDPVPDVISSIQKRGKLVVYEAEIRADATGKMDSSIWDAQVHSWANAHVQVYLDLSQLNPSWVTRSEHQVQIRIPDQAIQKNIILTQGGGNETNGSWAFSFSSRYEKDIIDRNKVQLNKQLNQTASDIRLAEKDLVRQQLENLFKIALDHTGYTVSVSLGG